MADVSGVGPSRPVHSAKDRSVRDTAKPTSKATPFQERAPLQIVSLATQLASEPPVIDQAKIAALRASLAKGDLAIEPRKIADILLGTVE